LEEKKVAAAWRRCGKNAVFLFLTSAGRGEKKGEFMNSALNSVGKERRKKLANGRRKETLPLNERMERKLRGGTACDSSIHRRRINQEEGVAAF